MYEAHVDIVVILSDLYGESSVRTFDAEGVEDFAQLTLDTGNSQLIVGAR